MNKRQLGKSGISVHPIGIGLWAMGGTQWGPTDDKVSLNTIDRALELGIDFFDTADVYGDGHSEVILGRAMKGRRDRFIVGTKIGWIGFDPEKNSSAYTSVEKVIQSVEENLKRLDTDYIDILQWHVHYNDGNMENFIEGCNRLKEQGKIRAYGVSSSNFPYLKEFYSAAHGDTLQIDYSILNRTSEEEIFPYCEKESIGTIIRGGLAMGILTGKFNAESRFEKDDFRNNWINDPEENRQFLADLQSVRQLQEAFPGQSLAQLALRFIISHRTVSVVIPGAKRIDQLEANFSAAEAGLLNHAEMELIDSIVAPGGGRKIWPA